MTSSQLVARLATALATAAVVAQAQAAPNVAVFVDNVAVGSVAWATDGSGGFLTLATTIGSLTVDGYEVNVGDSFAVNTTNAAGNGWDFGYGLGFNLNTLSAPRTLKLVYDVDFLSAPVGPTLEAFSSVVATLVDGTGSGVQITAPASGTVHSVTLKQGLTGVNAGLSLGPSFTGAATGNSGTPYAYGDFSVTQPVTGSYTGFTVVSEFTLAPGNSAVALDGVLTITAVPEPRGYALLLAGLAVVGFTVRRRLG
jgi:hypothetical protein